MTWKLNLKKPYHSVLNILLEDNTWTAPPKILQQTTHVNLDTSRKKLGKTKSPILSAPWKKYKYLAYADRCQPENVEFSLRFSGQSDNYYCLHPIVSPWQVIIKYFLDLFLFFSEKFSGYHSIIIKLGFNVGFWVWTFHCVTVGFCYITWSICVFVTSTTFRYFSCRTFQ